MSKKCHPWFASIPAPSVPGTEVPTIDNPRLFLVSFSVSDNIAGEKETIMAVILRPGRNEVGWSKDVECGGDNGYDRIGCGALLRITKADLFWTHGQKGNASELSCLCPLCSTRIVVDELFDGRDGLPSEQTWRAAHPDPQKEADVETRRAQATVYHGC